MVAHASEFIDQPPDRNSQSSLKQLCLKRDGFRCLATGVYQSATIGPPSADTGPTDLAHIIPFSIGQWSNNGRVCQRSS